MSKKRKKGRNTRFSIGTNGNDNRLIDRAEVAELIYGTLKDVAPEDIDGIQRTYVNISNDEVEVKAPSSVSSEEIASFYGMKPVAVADTIEPFPLIKTYEGPPKYDTKEKFNRSLIRQILSRIVDEA